MVRTRQHNLIQGPLRKHVGTSSSYRVWVGADNVDEGHAKFTEVTIDLLPLDSWRSALSTSVQMLKTQISMQMRESMVLLSKLAATLWTTGSNLEVNSGLVLPSAVLADGEVQAIQAESESLEAEFKELEKERAEWEQRVQHAEQAKRSALPPRTQSHPLLGSASAAENLKQLAADMNEAERLCQELQKFIRADNAGRPAQASRLANLDNNGIMTWFQYDTY
jgi:DNA repair exonuclease SbcCD ATPase subunit